MGRSVPAGKEVKARVDERGWVGQEGLVKVRQGLARIGLAGGDRHAPEDQERQGRNGCRGMARPGRDRQDSQGRTGMVRIAKVGPAGAAGLAVARIASAWQDRLDPVRPGWARSAGESWKARPGRSSQDG